MFIQVFDLHIPADMRHELTAALYTHYVPVLKTYDGFVCADMIATPDDVCGVSLTITWRNASCCHLANTDNRLIGAYLRLAADLPGMQIRQRGHCTEMLPHF
jgi:hypothetical protein